MRISISEQGGLRLERVRPGILNLLREVPRAADPGGDSHSLERLYPRPALDTEDPVNDDWTEFVQPDLQSLFESAHQTMQRDLETAVEGENGWSLEVSPRHFDAWVSALNQARLVLGARFKMDEAEMETDLPVLPAHPRDAARLQMHLYGFLLEDIIELQEMAEE